MNPLHLVGLAVMLFVPLAWYGLRRAAVADVPVVVLTTARALAVLVLGAIALTLVDPADVPSLLRAVLPKL
ncbi:hypothetical protein ACFV6U_28360 [Streptomyces sp. NPDC059810]|uniref:hypothetical protein n=1 Tax=Streptomyces sp. NPDC059810 TaxID=3346956 RepID=UPI0036624765